MDICTVVFRDEVDILHTQARSIELYCPDVENIYVVVNDSPNVVHQIDPGHWGRYRDQVQIIHRDAFGRTWCDNGWVSQQALKLSAAALSQSTLCMALDAKTIFIKPLPNMVENHRISVGLMPVYEVFEASRLIVNSLWDIDLQQQLTPGGVPFWFEPREVRAMIADIESRVGENFVSWFQAQKRLTEFILYSGWIEFAHGFDNKITGSCKIWPCNISHLEVDLVDIKLAQMHQASTVSIHRDAWSQLSQIQQDTYRALLRERLNQ